MREFMTWTFNTPVQLSANTVYAVDIGTTSSTLKLENRNSHIQMSGNEYTRGKRYTIGHHGVGDTEIHFDDNRDRIFHLDLGTHDSNDDTPTHDSNDDTPTHDSNDDTPIMEGTMSSSPTAPIVNGEDIANYGTSNGSEKWWSEKSSAAGSCKGQTFTTGAIDVCLKSITYQIADHQTSQPIKKYTVRVGTISGTTFTQIHSENFTQNTAWNEGEFMTWTFNTPVQLSANTVYAVDIGMTSSTSSWKTGIPYIQMSGNEYTRGKRYTIGHHGVGDTEIHFDDNRDRIFHLDLGTHDSNDDTPTHDSNDDTPTHDSNDDTPTHDSNDDTPTHDSNDDTPIMEGTMSSSPTAPIVNGEDIANYGTSNGSEKWWSEKSSAAGSCKGQTFTTGAIDVCLKSITYQIADHQTSQPIKKYTVRVGTISGTTFTQIHSENFTQNTAWNEGEFMTWTFNTPVQLSANTVYAVDIGMTSSTSSWKTGIPYIQMSGNEYTRGKRYTIGHHGVGDTEIHFDDNRDRIFHLDLAHPIEPSPIWEP